MTMQGAPSVGNNSKHNIGLTRKDLEGRYVSPEQQSAMKELVDPGKDVVDLFMRTAFKNQQEQRAAVLFLHKCNKYDIKKGKDLLLSYLASAPSVGGERAKMLLMAITGYLDPKMFQSGQYKAPASTGKQGQDNGL